MRHVLVVLALCLASLTVIAQTRTSDFEVTAVSVDKTTVVAGDRFTLTIRVRNNGPEPARDINLNLSSSYGGRLTLVGSTAPAGWTCASAVYASCFAETFAPGTEVEMTMTLLAPAQVRPNASLTITVFGGASLDRDLANNRKAVVVTLQRSSRRADLALSMNAPPNPVAENAPVVVTLAVRNQGPDALNNIYLPVRIDSFGRTLNVTYQGAGWTCGPSVAVTLCRRESLAAGATAPLELRFTAPDGESVTSVEASVYADQPHSDDNPSNELAYHDLYVGNASDWSRILLPVTMEETPGVNGSLWKAEITALIDTNEGLRMEPQGCGGLEDPCGRVPVQRAFDVRDEDLIVSTGNAQFLYVSRQHAHLLRVSTRVYDSARATETAGAFVPSARDEDFLPGGFSLIGIPIAPQFRTALRIYDYHGRDTPVVVGLYGDDANVPFSVTTHSLHVENPFTITTALLPGQPATAQIDLTPLIPPGTYERLRVAVRTLDASARLWGVVSITNNDTHHVTVVTP